MTPSKNNTRIYYLDAMRSVLMALGIVLHSAVVFTDSNWAIQNNETSQYFSALVDFVHLFRMPAFFIVSGFFCHMTLARYGSKSFLHLRIPRIIIPLVITAITLNTIQNIILVNYSNIIISVTQTSYWLEGRWVSHLWFLNCLVFYFIVAAVLHKYIPKPLNGIGRVFEKIIINSKGLYLLILPCVSIILLKISYTIPELPYSIYDLSIPDAIRYSPFFAFGTLLGQKRSLLIHFIKPHKVLIPALLISSYSIYSYQFTNSLIEKLSNFYTESLISWLLCSACFILFSFLFNRKSAFFSYLSEASYSIYLFHHIFIIIYGLILINTDFHIVIKFFILITSTFITTNLIHNFWILRSPALRYLFNGKYK